MNIRSKKGFTLIELLVVIAMIAVSMGIFVANLTSASNAKKCIYSIESLLAKCKINTLYRGQPVYLKISVSGKNIVAEYYEKGVLVEKKKIGTANQLSVTYKAGNEYHDVSEKPLHIAYVRGKNSLKNLEDVPGNLAVGSCTEIRVTQGNKSFKITIVPVTGNHKVVHC